MKKQKVNTKVYIQISYGPVADTQLTVEQFNKARTDNNFKKVMTSTVRANYLSEFNTKNKNLGELLQEVAQVQSTQEHINLVALTQDLQQYIVNNTVLVFPEIEKDCDEVVATNFTNRLIFDKSKMLYRTNIYRRFDTVELAPVEEKFLSFLDEYIINGLEDYIELSVNFGSTRYHIGNKYEFTISEFIAHRRENIKL